MTVRAMSVMHVTMRWGDGRGGVKQFIHNAFAALPKSGYRQTVASLGPVTGDDQGLPLLGPIVKGRSAPSPVKMGEMVRFFREMRPDAVHVHCNNGVGLLCAEAARRAGVRVRVAHSHNSALGGSELWKRAGDSVYKVLYGNAPTVRAACSASAGEWLFGDRPYSVVRNGIDLDRFRYSALERAAIREELGVPNGAVVVGLVGAGIPVKNAAFALDVAKAACGRGVDAHLVLVGEGEESGFLRERAYRIGVAGRAHFVGTVDDVWRYYSAMDALVMPSFYEGLPISLIEAQANGIPCIVSDVVSDEADVTGLVGFAPLGECDEWADRLIKALGDAPKRGGGASDACIERVRTAGFSIGDLASQLEALYEKGLKDSEAK